MLPLNVARIRTDTRTINVFGGLNETEIISENEFQRMENITGDMLPGLATRKKRGNVIKKLKKPNALYWKNEMFYVDGTSAYYKNEKICEVTDTEKQIVGIGAYICIYPDKKIYNTATESVEEIESTFSQSGSMSVAPVSSGSTFVKISCKGIGKKFNSKDAVNITGFNKYSKQLNTIKIIQEKSNDYIVVIAAGVESFNQSSGVKVTRLAPDLDFVCEHNNRLWGCNNKKHEIYASKLGDPRNWNAFEGISTDSYAANIGSDGDFTGCIAHQGYVVFFKEDYIHTVYGSKPSNFQIDTANARGPAKGCEKSLIHVNESVMYAARNDICVFEGSVPESVSEKIKIKWKEARAGQYEGKYYISLKDMAGVWHLYVYDAKTSALREQKLWFREDNTEIKYSTHAEGRLYIIDQNNEIRNIYAEEKEKLLHWILESGNITDGSLNKKKVHRLQFDIEMDIEAAVALYIQYDNDPRWVRYAAITADHRGVYTLPVKLRRCNRYKFKLEGYGNIKLYAMTRKVEGGSSR